MKKSLIGIPLAVACAAFGSANAGQVAPGCTEQAPVRLFVGFVYLDKTKTKTSYGNALLCFDKEIESEDDIKRLQALFKPRHEGDVTTILSFTTMRK